MDEGATEERDKDEEAALTPMLFTAGTRDKKAD